MPDRLDFLVVGTGRSGTTLARAILQGHSRLALPGETGFVPQLMRARPLWWRRRFHRELFVRLAFANGRLVRAGFRRSELAASLEEAPPAGPAEAIGRIYALHAQKAGAETVGDKTPGYIRHVGLLSAWFPDLRVIRMVRDPLHVVASLRQQLWAPDSALACAQQWLDDQHAFGAVEADARCLTVRLEDLIVDPEAVARSMTEHLRHDFEPAMLQFQARAAEVMSENIHPEAHAGLTRSLHEQRNWRDQLTDHEAAAVWALVGEPAERLGYCRPDVAIRTEDSAAVSRHARRELAWFAARRRWRTARTAARVLRP